MDLQWIGEVLLPRLLAASLQSLLLVAAILLLVRWLRPSAAVRCWLWWCAALQLLLGALWPARLEVPLLPAHWQRAAEVAASPRLSPAAQLPYLVTRADVTAAPAHAAASAEAMQWLSWPALFAGLWLAGLVVLAAAGVRGYLAVRRRVAAARACEHAPTLSAYRSLGASLGLRRLPPLRVSAQIDSPQLVGPPATVLLPQRQLAQLSDDELAMALHHELTHLRRRDLWWGWVPALARQLFFFHPLAHVIAREYAIAREQACDAAVLGSRRYDAHDYGRLLLRLGVAPRPATGVAGASPTYTVLKRRLIMLQNSTSPARLSGVALAVAVAVLGLVPYKVTAAAEEAALAAGKASRVNIRDSRDGEHRITEIGDGKTQVWAIKGGQYYQVLDDGRYEPVRDAATRARLDRMQRDAAQAEVEAAKAVREAEQAMREAEAAGRDAEAAGREAEAAGRDAERAATQARHDARRAQAEAARARQDADRDRAEAMREGERARRDAAQARLDAEQARRDAGQRQRDREQAQRDAQQARRDAEQARRDAGQRQRDAEQVRLDAEQQRRDAQQRRRDQEQAARDRAQAQAVADSARRAVCDLDLDAIGAQAIAAARDSEAIRSQALRAAAEAMRAADAAMRRDAAYGPNPRPDPRPNPNPNPAPNPDPKPNPQPAALPRV